MLRKFNDLQQLNAEVAALFVQTAQACIAERGHFTVALTGGTSPVDLYRLLASTPHREQIDWEQVYVFWGDERWVPLDDERSNARMAFETLLSHVSVPKANIFPMWSDGVSPEEFAREYEQSLRKHLSPDGSFDLILLGMGGDGHTASLFPHTEVLHERNKWVAAYYLDAQNMYRITLTVPVINRANRIAVVAYGANKADALYEVLKGKPNFEQYPAQLVDNEGDRVTWFVDEAAAARI